MTEDHCVLLTAIPSPTIHPNAYRIGITTSATSGGSPNATAMPRDPLDDVKYSLQATTCTQHNTTSDPHPATITPVRRGTKIVVSWPADASYIFRASTAKAT